MERKSFQFSSYLFYTSSIYSNFCTEFTLPVQHEVRSSLKMVPGNAVLLSVHTLAPGHSSDMYLLARSTYLSAATRDQLIPSKKKIILVWNYFNNIVAKKKTHIISLVSLKRWDYCPSHCNSNYYIVVILLYKFYKCTYH